MRGTRNRKCGNVYHEIGDIIPWAEQKIPNIFLLVNRPYYLMETSALVPYVSVYCGIDEPIEIIC